MAVGNQGGKTRYQVYGTITFAEGLNKWHNLFVVLAQIFISLSDINIYLMIWNLCVRKA